MIIVRTRVFWGLASLLLVMVGSGLADTPDPTVQASRKALKKAGRFYHQQVAVHGGYVYRYSSDLSLREGEGITDLETVWVQPPGTPTVGLAFLQASQRTGDQDLMQAARDAAHCLLEGQLQSGAWNDRICFAPDQRARHAYITTPSRKNARNYSTFDDDKSQSALRFLMAFDQATGFKEERIHKAVLRALESVLLAQFSHGGFPQGYKGPVDQKLTPVGAARFPETWQRVYPGGDYWDFPTLNDNAHMEVVEMLFMAADIYQDNRYRQAALKGGEFLLKAQLPDPQPAWAQQYNYNFEPCWARKFEPPAISGSESQKVVRQLLDLFVETGDRRYLESAAKGLKWLESVVLPDGKLARFYELKTNVPLYFDRQYRLTTDDSDLPTHYGFKVNHNLPELRQLLERLSKIEPEQLGEQRRKLWGRNPEPRVPTESQVKAIIKALDDRGAWVETGTLNYHPGKTKARQVILSETFRKNMDLLSQYVAAHSSSSPQ